MNENNNTSINLAGSDYVSNIPAVYYGTTSSLVERLVDKDMGKVIGLTTLPGGTIISTTVNIVKDPDNPSKVIYLSSFIFNIK